MKRRSFIALLGGAAATWPLPALGQQAAVPVIGYLDFASPQSYAPLLAGFRQGLNESGDAERRNVIVEYRWADNQPDRLADLAADLVRRHVALIVATPTNAAMAAAAATTSIPIVFGVGVDPIAAGLVKSLNHPSSNATGRYYFTQTLTAKRLGLLHELVPSGRRIAMLQNSNGTVAATEVAKTEAQAAAAAIGLELEIFYATTSREIDAAFVDIAKKRANALLISPASLYINRRVQLITLSVRDRLPTIFPSREFAESGGLMTYGTDNADEWRQMR
jgi:ABC-type uncharacterized transport system substrate-binding protein